MSGKWELGGLDKFESGPDAEWEWCIESGDDLIATVPTGETQSAAARAAEKPRAIAQQIVREHNAHDALVEALRRVLSLGITHHTEKEARAALALAKGADDE